MLRTLVRTNAQYKLAEVCLGPFETLLEILPSFPSQNSLHDFCFHEQKNNFVLMLKWQLLKSQTL